MIGQNGVTEEGVGHFELDEVATGGQPPSANAETKPEGGGYRETPHIRQYYDTAKF